MFASRRGERPEDIVALTGASLVSAVGSLPQHLAPFLTMAMIAGGWTSVAGSGWVRSVALIGDLAITLALPLIGIASLGRKAVCVVALTMVLGIAMAGTSHQALFMLGWLLIGVSSGALKYFGTMAAAKASQLSFAFTLRIAAVLLLAGAVSAALASHAGLLSYDSMLLALAVIVSVVLVVGMTMLRNAPPERVPAGERPLQAEPTRSFFTAVSGLVMTYVFVVGFSGVMVFVLHQAAGRQLTIAGAAWAIAATKFAVGVWLVVSACTSAPARTGDRFWLQGAILVAATVGISASRDSFELLIALFFWEVSVNGMSARIMAAVVKDAPAFTSRYINLAILLGAATGPAINGLLVSSGHAYAYVLLGSVTAFAPALWVWALGERERADAPMTLLPAGR